MKAVTTIDPRMRQQARRKTRRVICVSMHDIPTVINHQSIPCQWYPDFSGFEALQGGQRKTAITLGSEKESMRGNDELHRAEKIADLFYVIFSLNWGPISSLNLFKALFSSCLTLSRLVPK